MNKYTALFLLSLFHLTVFGQAKKYDPIKINVDKINPIYAFIERTSPDGNFIEKVLKTNKDQIKQIQADKNLKFEGFEFVDIDQIVTYWIQAKAKNRNCCWGPENCKVWALAEMDLVYTDSIYLYKEQKTVSYNSEIFPNPCEDLLTINAKSKISQIIILDIWGREVFQKYIGSKSKNIHIKHLVSGQYIVQLKLNDEIESHKFIKR